LEEAINYSRISSIKAIPTFEYTDTSTKFSDNLEIQTENTPENNITTFSRGENEFLYELKIVKQVSCSEVYNTEGQTLKEILSKIETLMYKLERVTPFCVESDYVKRVILFLKFQLIFGLIEKDKEQNAITAKYFNATSYKDPVKWSVQIVLS
jgi:hypothetical protein